MHSNISYQSREISSVPDLIALKQMITSQLSTGNKNMNEIIAQSETLKKQNSVLRKSIDRQMLLIKRISQNKNES